MTAQDHEYELGTLDEETLERDETLARKRQQRGDERRWMILGGAGTLALMAALVGAISLGGSSEPHHLAASLGSPVRDIAPIAAKAIVDQEPEAAETAKPSTPSKKAQVAHKGTAPATAAAKNEEPRASAAIPAATSPAATSPVTRPAPAPTPAKAVEAKAVEDDSAPFAGLPSLPTVSDPDPEEDDEPAGFEHDDSPFVDEDTVDEAEEDEDEGEADVAEVAPAPTPDDAPAPVPTADDAPAPAPAADETPERPTPV